VCEVVVPIAFRARLQRSKLGNMEPGFAACAGGTAGSRGVDAGQDRCLPLDSLNELRGEQGMLILDSRGATGSQGIVDYSIHTITQSFPGSARGKETRTQHGGAEWWVPPRGAEDRLTN